MRAIGMRISDKRMVVLVSQRPVVSLRLSVQSHCIGGMAVGVGVGVIVGVAMGVEVGLGVGVAVGWTVGTGVGVAFGRQAACWQ